MRGEELRPNLDKLLQPSRLFPVITACRTSKNLDALERHDREQADFVVKPYPRVTKRLAHDKPSLFKKPK